MGDQRSPFSAAEQGLGYIYQARFALLKILTLPESSSILLEKEDDVEFSNDEGQKSLGSLKHKAVTDTLTDLSLDFWKSVRIWLAHYVRDGRRSSNSQFFLFTTAGISEHSMLRQFTAEQDDVAARASAATAALAGSESQTLGTIRKELAQLNLAETEDFYNRITIFPAGPRITEIPAIVLDQHLRTVHRESRLSVYERLEGWWLDLVIKILSGERDGPVFGYEVSDKLAAIADEYRVDNLPITFRNKLPSGVDAENDNRLFVKQLKELKLSTARIQSAIIDYYRAFEQRSSWARENLLISGEIEEYEDRLVEEWARYREVAFEGIDDSSKEEACIEAGKELYHWAEFQTESLRIRARVTEPYVVRGAFHILANSQPIPRVHWHPWFLRRLRETLGVAA